MVGSRLLGRGLDIPRIKVVYNSTVTFSPQVFWQVDGRGLRIDPKGKEKTKSIIAVLPLRMIQKKTGRVLLPEERPLSHATFFDEGYYEEREKPQKNPRKSAKKDTKTPKKTDAIQKKEIRQFNLSEIKNIRSIQTIQAKIEKYKKKPVDFRGKPELLANFLEQMHETVSIEAVLYACNMNNRRLVNGTQYLRDDEERYFSLTGKESTDLQQEASTITLEEEREWLEEYAQIKGSPLPQDIKRAKEIQTNMLKAHLNVITAIAKIVINKNSAGKEDLDDLIQIGSIVLLNAMDSYSGGTRFVKYLIYGLGVRMERYLRDNLKKIAVSQQKWDTYPEILKLNEFTMPDGSKPSLDDIASLLCMRRNTILGLVQCLQPAQEREYNADTDQPSGGDMDELIQKQTNPEEEAQKSELKEIINKRFKKNLSPLEKIVLKHYYALMGNRELTLTEIGNGYELSRSRIAQIKNKALFELRMYDRNTFGSQHNQLKSYWED